MSDMTKQEQDFADLNAELAGRNNNRINRFIANSADITSEKKKEDRDWEMLQGEITRMVALRTKAIEIEITRSRIAVQRALEENAIELQRVSQELAQMRETAPQDENGFALFQTRDGTKIFREDGVQLTDEQAANVTFEKNSVTWERYSADLDQQQSLLEERQELQEYQEKLDDAAEQLERGDLSLEELDGLKDMVGDRPPRVNELLNDPDQRQMNIDADRSFESPSLAATFARADAAPDRLIAPENLPNLASHLDTPGL